ncbi:MAG: CCA tRNA nucleotidyltransferase [Proteocatella sp.]
MRIHQNAEYIIDTLINSGYEAYIVGGCVRDFLMKVCPYDWDVTTNAKPEEIKAVFADYKTIDTGIKHGTVTVRFEGQNYEITTYRTDGKYISNRKPESVIFIDNLKEDLKRRDFTINAMAYNKYEGLIDFFGGQKDIEDHLIRCVGNPDSRLSEDALRIMRALRFASEKGFEIEPKTYRAMCRHKNLLTNISSERIASELNKILLGDYVFKTLKNYAQPLFQVIPELELAVGFKQNNPHHSLDVYDHILSSVSNAPKDLELRLTMLFHDIGKPFCYTQIDGTGHFYGHSKISAEIAGKTLKKLKYDSNTIEHVTKLVLHHGLELIPSPKIVRRNLSRYGQYLFEKLLEAKQADIKAANPDFALERLEHIKEVKHVLKEVLKSGQCFSMKDLSINGSDIMELGIAEGKEIGIILKTILDMVIDGELENDRDAIIKKIRFMEADKNSSLK